jgi:hypothetical protein
MANKDKRKEKKREEVGGISTDLFLLV